MTTTVCLECGHEISFGQWAFCPHGEMRESPAMRMNPITVWESTTAPGTYSFPGRADEPVPDGYRAVSLTNLREADKFVGKFNESERERITMEREYERAYFDDRLKRRRDDTLARLSSNPRAVAMIKAVAELRERKRDKKYARKIDPHFHIQALSFDAGNRQGYSGPETNWKDRK